MLYNYLFPDGVWPDRTRYIDIRDVAQAHVRALTSPPTSAVGRKRLIISSPTGWPFSTTCEFIAAQRPALRDRLIRAEGAAQAYDVLPMDFVRVEEVLGMKKSDFHTVDETTLDTIDALVKVEEEWRVMGRAIVTPPSM